jgi:hypothetical protein
MLLPLPKFRTNILIIFFFIQSALSFGGSLQNDLVDFNAEESKDGIVISWQMLAENNVDVFIVEKSADGIHFSEASRTSSLGSSTNPHFYSVTDKNPAEGQNYYRLLKRTLDGQEEISEMLSVNYSGSSILCESFPNPCTTGTIFLRIKKGNTQLTILGYLGRTILTMNFEEPGDYSIEAHLLNTEESDTYFLVLTNDDEIQTMKQVVHN